MSKRVLKVSVYSAILIAFVGIFLIVSGNKTPDHLPAQTPVESEPLMLTAFDSMLISYDSILCSYMDSINTVGAAFAVSYKGKTRYVRCYGVKEAGTRDSINAETIFRLASVSKTVTGVLAGILDAKDDIHLNSRVKDYLPGFQLRDSVNTEDLTIAQILSHTSGLVPHAYDNLVEAKVPYHIIYDSLFRVNISAKPGEVYGYQNFVFSLYDTICQVCMSETFKKTMQMEVFDLLGMKQASVGFESFRRNTNKALPHSGRRTLKLNDRYYLTNPAAGVNASIRDMSQLMNALTAKTGSPLPNSLIDSIFKPRIYTPLKWYYLRRWDKVDSRHYGIGWRIIGYKGKKVAYHGGYLQGYRAEIAVCPEENIGICFLSNSPKTAGSYSIPTFLDMYFKFISKLQSQEVDTCNLDVKEYCDKH